MKAALKPELKLGGNTRQYILLGVLLVVLVGVWLLNRTGDEPSRPSSGGSAAPAAVATAPAPGIKTPVRPATRITRGSSGRGGRGLLSVQEFHPTLKPKDPIDTSKVDPTLRLDVLAKLRSGAVSSGGRSVFDFAGGTPAPGAAPIQIAKVEKIRPRIDGVLTTGPRKPAPPPPPAPKPPPPAIPLKFYGYTNAQQRQGVKRAFFLEGEDIWVAGEGETIKNRYKIIRIGVNSAVVEDLQYKNQQTLPLVEEVANT